MGFFSTSELKKCYDIGPTLGSGAFAVVKECTNKKANENKFPAKVAIKVIDKRKVDDMNDVKREIEIMHDLQHEGIIRLFEIFDESKKMHLVMELVTGGELFDRIIDRGNYSERDAADVIRQVCSALDYMHGKRVVHRDLKPENILYASPAEDAIIKIADFGLATVVSGKEMMKTACGTPGYVAPEILKNKGYEGSGCDLWSTGVILYILLCGFPPFHEEDMSAMFELILKARYDFISPYWDEISAEAKSLVSNMLTLDPKKRYTAAQVNKDLWIKNATSNHKIEGAQKALKKFNATRKLKKATLGLLAQSRMT